MTETPFQVLALDGGGVKAIFTAHVLAGLEADHGVVVADHFDLIVGTSAGGIIALALGAGLRPAEIIEHYERLASEVFPASRRRWHHKVRWPWRPRYRQAPLRRALDDVLGDRQLWQSGKRLVVTSYDTENSGVHLFKTPHHPRLRRDWRVPMIDVALATSAAPTFLPAARVAGFRLVDGGVWANNPSVIGIAEAISMCGVQLKQLRVLNVGTTTECPDHPPKLDTAGLIGWRRAAPFVLDSTSRGVAGTAEHLVGRERFTRIDATVPEGLFALDDSDPDRLRARAHHISRHAGPGFAVFTKHQAAPFTPLHAPEGRQ